MGGKIGGIIDKVNLAEKFDRFEDHWQPGIVGEINDTHVKLVKLQGEFVWHQHEAEDELFFVVKGSLRILLREGEFSLEPGDVVTTGTPSGVGARMNPPGLLQPGDQVALSIEKLGTQTQTVRKP